MSVDANRAAIERLLEAVRARDEDGFAAAYADDAIVRQSGVPASLGGVLRGRDAIVEGLTAEVRKSIGDFRLSRGEAVGSDGGVVEERLLFRRRRV